MKVFAIHDAAGVISEIVTAPAVGPSAGIVTRAGWSMTEIEAPANLKSADDHQGHVQALAAVIQQYRVVVKPGVAALTRQDGAAS
jgi:hypothetical protein